MKTCDNCCLKFQRTKLEWCIYKEAEPKKKVCEKHEYECENYDCREVAEFELNGDKLCKECAFLELGINTKTTRQYYSYDWEYCFGDDDNDEIEEIIEKACKYENIEYKNLFDE